MKNSLNKYIFLNILFLIGVVTTVDIYAAKPNSKRASRSKSSTPTKKKTSLSSSSETTTSVESSEDRSVSGTVTSRPGRTTISTTSSSAVDDDTAAELLASNLLACLQSPCYGDVPYEKCFTNGAPESYTRANTTCLGMYNGAANDVIRVKAMNQVNTKIKSYFADACETAGGRVSGNTCKINVCYHAKAGSHSTTRCMDYNVGKQVTCSYGAFGLSQQDLEYKEDMTSEQLGTIIQAGMTTLNGLLDTGVAIVNTVQASKKLKSGSTVKGKDCYGIYSYDTQKIVVEPTYCMELWDKCGGTGKKKDCKPEDKTRSDSAGNWYKASAGNSNKTLENWNSDDARKEADNSRNLEDCSLIKNLKDITSGEGENKKTEKQKCLVKLSEWTDVAVQEQEASLYKKFTDFDSLKMDDAINTYVKGAQVASLQQNIQNFGQAESEECSTWVGDRRQYKEDDKGRYTSTYASCAQLASVHNQTAGNEHVSQTECVERDGACFCKLDLKKGCENAIKKNGGYYADKEVNYTTQANKLKEKVGTFKTELGDLKTNSYSSAQETFNSMQKKVNEEKQKITTLEEQKNTGMQKAIQSGAQTLTSGGTALTMALIDSKNNKGIMTGACYIGDPRAGGVYLMSDNEVKKLSWKNL